jgi:hypothetical protein
MNGHDTHGEIRYQIPTRRRATAIADTDERQAEAWKRALLTGAGTLVVIAALIVFML